MLESDAWDFFFFFLIVGIVPGLYVVVASTRML